MDSFIPDPFTIFVIVAVLAALLIIYSGVKVVPQAQEWTVERFGRYIRTLSPGLNLIVPFVDNIGNRLSLRETVLDIPTQDVITLDNATVTADGVVFYQVVDAPKAAYEVNDLERAMSNLAMTNIRSVIGSMALDDVLSRRDDINERLLRVIDAATNPWGIKVTRIEIKDLTPPADLTRSMNQQMMAERQKRAEILQAEGDKQGAILRAEGDKQSAILQAEGRREAAFRDAEAREREAEAEAKATSMVSESIANGDVQAVNYFVAQRYVDALGKIASAPNQRVVMLPLEATSLLGSLGGIAELARATFAKDGSGPSTASDPASGPWDKKE
ncbi:MAG: SPFH/Band 7/PHB domain protein [Rhodospirillaceae bacterium]|nr:SPFH/Band 7/PHB domain protein [Rhodospirillaceae bacterium]MBT6140289.1 SPFH/Band 7/PHB domain protein [Rhodospirillaceae bacterium]